jgi:hypothetical protein
MAANPPDVGQIARQIMRAMIVQEPVIPAGWARASDADGRPLYTIAIVMGSENCVAFEKTLQDFTEYVKPVDCFDSPGEINVTDVNVDN